MRYKIESKNTTQFIDLHDCQCSQMNYENSNLVLEMEWIEILGEHPENPYDKAHQSGEGRIEFNSTVIINCEFDEKNITEKIENNKYFRIDNIEIMSFYEGSRLSEGYKYAKLSAFTYDNKFIILEFIFKDSEIMWNNLNDESWFEDYKWKQNTQSTKEILKMLSWNNSEEVQKKGLKLALDIKYIGYLFQPFIDGESKSLWENCAIVLSEKTDEELKLWLLQCLIWLQNMNWPGTVIIAQRLLEYKNKKSLGYAKNKAVKIAQILNDDVWLENLNEII